MTQLETERTITLPTGTWKVDPAHSGIEFGIKHLLITTVKGSFDEFEGVIEVPEDGLPRAAATIKTESIDTNEPQRDEHLRSPDFFDASYYPAITFESKRIEPSADGAFRILGELTIKGQSRELELEADLQGTARDPWGNDRVGVVVRGELTPTDFGVDWNQELESGGNLVGDRVSFSAEISAIRAG